MSYRFAPSESPADGLRRIVAEQATRGLADLRDPDLGTDASVHQVRKRCKKIRGALRLLRGALGKETYARENRRYRDAARLVAGLRDAAVMAKTLESLVPDAAGARERAGLEAAIAALPEAEAIDAEEALEALAAALRAGRDAALALPLEAEDFDAVAPGLGRSYRDGRADLARAAKDPDAERLHDWRKRVKDHWYHVRLLAPVWQAPMKARRAELSRLADLLGDEHDYAVLAERIAGTAPEVDAVMPLIARRRAALQREAFLLGRKVYAEKPKGHVRRMRGAWEAWHEAA